MISANNVTYRVGKKALFEDVNIKFTEGNCYGIIGANGAGKSTFLKILSGELETTNGDIAITPGERLSVLEQDHFKYDDYTVMDTVIMGNARLYEIMKEKDALYAKEDFSDEDGIRAADLEAEFANMDSESIDYGIMEKAANIYVIPGTFGWDDVGSWLAVGRIRSTNEFGNAVQGNVITVETKNSIIEGTDKLIAAVGLQDIIVVDTEDALLICDKGHAGDIKKVLENLRICNRNEYI